MLIPSFHVFYLLLVYVIIAYTEIYLLYMCVLLCVEYLAPEFIFAEGCDRAVDLWALGCLVFEMYVGHTPFINPDQPTDVEFTVNAISRVKVLNTFQSH